MDRILRIVFSVGAIILIILALFLLLDNFVLNRFKYKIEDRHMNVNYLIDRRSVSDYIQVGNSKDFANPIEYDENNAIAYYSKDGEFNKHSIVLAQISTKEERYNDFLASVKDRCRKMQHKRKGNSETYFGYDCDEEVGSYYLYKKDGKWIMFVNSVSDYDLDRFVRDYIK